MERHFHANIQTNITNKYSSVNGFPRFWGMVKRAIDTRPFFRASVFIVSEKNCPRDEARDAVNLLDKIILQTKICKSAYTKSCIE